MPRKPARRTEAGARASGWLPRAGFQSFLIASLIAPALNAEVSQFEFEPNDTPAEANPISGAVTVLGTMNENDQDGFLWTVSDVDARKRWVFELHGIPGRLTIAEIVRVEFAANGVDVARKDTLMKMGTRDGYTPSITRDLVFEPGEYLIGIAYAGGSPAGDQGGGGAMFRPPSGRLSFGDDGEPATTDAPDGAAIPSDPETGAYRFFIRSGDGLNVQNEPATGGSMEDAHAVRPGSEFADFETRASAWYAFDFKPGESDQRWDIRVQVPVGRTADATLFDAAGAQLDTRRSGERGHLEFPGIVPQAQPFYLRVEPQQPGFVTAVASEAVGQRVAGEEAEPNGTWALANRVDFSQPLTARVDEVNESDYFKFSLDEETVDQLRVLRLESEPAGQDLRLCLHDALETRMQCRDAKTPVELPDLLLGPGDWGLVVSRTRATFEYRVSLAAQGPIEPGVETEPNDEIAFASSVPSNHRIKGRASGAERDYYRFIVAEEPQLWRFQVIGDGLREIGYHDGAGKQVARLRPESGQRRLRLDNVFLLPGKHYLGVQAEDGAEYTVLARPLGPPDPNGEREPNDDTSRMQRLSMGQTRTGLLADKTDRDYYRFFLGNRDHVRLTVEPPPDGLVQPIIHWYDKQLAQGIPSEPGQVMSIEGVFPPGDYHVELGTREPSDAEYRVSLERLPRYSCASDCEPNGMNRIWLTAPVPPDLVLEGTSGWWRDTDVYRLPALTEPSALVIRSPEPAGRIYIGPNHTEKDELEYDAQAGVYRGSVPAGAPQLLTVDSRREPYRLELEFENGPAALADPDLPVDLELTLETDRVSAFRTHGQQIAGQLKLANRSTSPRAARLEATTSDYRWHVELAEAAVEIAADAAATVPVQIRVPPDAWADRVVRVSVRAFDAAGAQTETWAEVEVDRDLAAVRPAWNWPIPEALRGGFNAAWLPFGGRLAGDQPKGADDPLLRDGMVFDNQRVACCAKTSGWSDTRPAVTLELPGGEPVPVAGIAINHFGVPWPLHNLRQGTLLLSQDGQNYEEVLTFETLPVLTEQYFPMDAPRMARFAALRMEETYEERSGAGGVTMGEWKVILEPGFDLSSGQGYDLADPELGGHLVWDSPPQFYSPVAILDEDRKPNPVRAKPGVNLEYVIGFRDNRAAQIQRVEWINSEGLKPEYALARIILSVSTESPAGPWTAIGELDPGISTTPAVAELETPVWARFVKFTGIRQGDSGIVGTPNLIRIRERPAGADYLSAIGEWGQNSSLGYYEIQRGIPPEAERAATGNESKDTAAALSPGQAVNGQVELAKRTHWYRLQMPPDVNTLTIAMSGSPTVRTVLALENAAGTPVPMKQSRRESTPSRHVFEAFVEPGSEVYLHVSEPPRNVVFSWDTSASVNAHLATIYNALTAFVGQVVPGQESANFVPFGRGPLLDSWLGEPYMLQTILNDYPRRESSSAGERALQVSTQTLAPVAGTKAVMIISDGAVNHHGPMWKDLREIQPRVFGVGIAGSEAGNIDVFQDWVDVNGGYYTQLNYKGEMEVAFDRVATLMRRPADYTLGVEAEFREAPGPGSLRVVTGGDADGDGDAVIAGGAVELILDASGSMLQRMDGKRRIVIAREVLTEAVREVIPAGTPVALRVFGHKEPNACRTDLEIPLAPLDPAQATRVIEGIQAMNLARTPIADSLAAVEGDLAGTDGRAVIVLVTDGEETCEGDPAKAIESLQDKGIDVHVNIVGFAIDDAELEAQFEAWAELGGGRYFSARDQEGLSGALEAALQVPFTVYDTAGTMVAEGVVGGEPVELEQGVYRIEAATSPPQVFEEVEIPGEQETTVTLE